MENNEPNMIWKSDPKMANDNDQTNDWVESDKCAYNCECNHEYNGDIELGASGIGSIIVGIALSIAAVIEYITAHYILAAYAGIQIFIYMSYCFAFIGILFIILGFILMIAGMLEE